MTEEKWKNRRKKLKQKKNLKQNLTSPWRERTQRDGVYSNQKQLLLFKLGSIPNESAVLIINTLPFEM